MKKSFLLGAIVAVLGLAVVPSYAQTQTSTSTSSTGYIESSKIIGTTVKSSSGEDIGTVKDIVLDRNTGCMAYTVLATGGTGARVTGSSKTVAVPWSVYQVDPSSRTVTVRVDKQRIYSAPAFDYARIDEYSRPEYINQVYSYYGVSPSVGIGVSAGGGYSGGTTTSATTGTTTTGSAASTNATASPAASATASPMGTATPAASASPSASASASASASPSATAAGTSAKHGKKSEANPTGKHVKEPTGTTSESGASPTTSGKHHKGAASESATGTSSSEEEGTTSGSTSKTKHHKAEKSGSESSASPAGTPEE